MEVLARDRRGAVGIPMTARVDQMRMAEVGALQRLQITLHFAFQTLDHGHLSRPLEVLEQGGVERVGEPRAGGHVCLARFSMLDLLETPNLLIGQAGHRPTHSIGYEQRSKLEQLADFLG
jgi:hypothetical protein